MLDSCDKLNQSPFTPKAARLRRASCSVVAHRRAGIFKSATMKREKICGVYRFIYKDGREYIGSGTDVYGRRGNHLGSARGKSMNYFHTQLRELGVENFKFYIIETCRLEVRFKREAYYIKTRNSVYPNGFNLKRDPTKSWDHVYAPETRRRLSLAMLGKKHKQETKDKIGAAHRGMKRTAETCRNISLGQLRRPPPNEETLERMRLAQIGNKNALGHRLSKRVKRNLVLAQRKGWKRRWAQGKFSNSMKGKPWSKARRAAQSKGKSKS